MKPCFKYNINIMTLCCKYVFDMMTNIMKLCFKYDDTYHDPVL